MTPGILSTKTLEPGQKQLILNSGLSLVEKNFISIIPIPFDLTEIKENIIFTSRNAVNIVLENSEEELIKSKRIFCVGGKTAEYLRKKGFTVAESFDYGADLAQKISKNYSGEEFLFFCGKRRRPELPAFLNRNKVPLEEIHVYDTRLLGHKMERIYQGVLFFSPSAVKSYCSANDLKKSIAFCIGKTTAREATKYTNKTVTAKKPSVENVIVQAVNYFRNNSSLIN